MADLAFALQVDARQGEVRAGLAQVGIQHPGQLLRAAVELAKDWRTDRYLRRLEAMMLEVQAWHAGAVALFEDP